MKIGDWRSKTEEPGPVSFFNLQSSIFNSILPAFPTSDAVMDLSPWLTLRQAFDAVGDDRPDEAHRLIAPLLDEGYRKAWRVARDVAKGHCRRASRSLDRDLNAEAAWRDLLCAEA